MNQGEVATDNQKQLKSNIYLVSIPYESGRSGHNIYVNRLQTNILVSIPYESGRSGHYFWFRIIRANYKYQSLMNQGEVAT